MLPRPTFADRLHEILRVRQMEAQELAAKAGIPTRTMTSYATGVTQPRADQIAKMCDILNVPADYLLGRADSRSGLVPGQWLADLEECEQPTGRKDAFLVVEIPKKHAVVDRKRAMRYLRDAKKKLTGKEVADDDESLQP